MLKPLVSNNHYLFYLNFLLEIIQGWSCFIAKFDWGSLQLNFKLITSDFMSLEKWLIKFLSISFWFFSCLISWHSCNSIRGFFILPLFYFFVQEIKARIVSFMFFSLQPIIFQIGLLIHRDHNAGSFQSIAKWYSALTMQILDIQKPFCFSVQKSSWIFYHPVWWMSVSL